MEIFVGIKQGRLIIQNTEDEYILKYNDELDVFVNDKKINRTIIITSKDKVEIANDGSKAKRKLDIRVSKDKLSAYITLEYFKSTYFNTEIEVIENTITLIKKIDGEMPPIYSKEEIISALKKSGIVYGIKKDILEKLNSYEKCIDMLIAEGVAPIDDEEDRINVNFENTKRTVEESSLEKVDYRNFYTNASASVGDLLGEKFEGQIGKDGMDIYGKPIIRKIKHKIKFRAAEGCRLDGNKIIATSEGRPTIKNGIFSINKLFSVESDVDMKRGDIRFVGDVEIDGNIKDGMTVKAGNSVHVDKNVESASIIAQGRVEVKGNVINSKILAGARDVEKNDYLSTLESYKKTVEDIIAGVDQLKDYGSLGIGKTDGELIKILIDTKYKSFQRVSMVILTSNKTIGNNNSNLDRFIRSKLIGIYINSIKFVNELYELVKYLEEEIVILAEQVNIPVDVYVNYSQDSKIKASGNIIITGKGQYISEFIANESIEFLEEGAICRGGTLVAGKNIYAKVIGSVAGVSTTLKVPKEGIIKAEVVYSNSVFVFGQRQYIVETPCKSVKAFLDKDGDVSVEKFVL